jgi:hypothetical protein
MKLSEIAVLIWCSLFALALIWLTVQIYFVSKIKTNKHKNKTK